MKAIMISDHAKWCVLMMNGIKKIEVRKGTALYKATKKLIDEYGFAEFYVYCSKINRKHYHLIEVIDTDTGETEYEIDYYIGSENYLVHCYEGKVAFKFRCYKVEEIENEMWADYEHDEYMPRTKTCDWDMLEYKSRVDLYDIRDYLDGDTGCAIHISDLEIFDKPRELSEFRKYEYIGVNVLSSFIKNNRYKQPLTKAPQSYYFIEVE